MDSLGVKEPNKQYQHIIEFTRMVRDAVGGESIIKSADKIQHYLPNPCADIKDAQERERRYTRYSANAEFDDVPSQTLDSICGSVFRKPTDFNNVKPQIKYLLDDADGDGLTMDELLKIGLSELLMMRYFGMLAEYSDLSTVSVDELTVSEAKKLGAKSSIKMYPRESIINWDFKRINGVLQLSMVILKEVDSVKKAGGFSSKEVDCYLVLGLDDDGEYYQRKYIDTGDGEWSDYYYPTADGKRWNFIPFEICVADNLPQGKLPINLGYLSGICSKILARFRASADMKEALYLNGAPMTYSTGWDENSLELYKTMTGNDYIVSSAGSHLPLPMGSSVGVMSWDMATSAYADYMDRNEREIRALGGKFDTSDGVDQETATAAIIKAADKNGSLSNSVLNLEKSINRVLGYCATYLGGTEGGNLILNREFYVQQINAQERAIIVAEWQSGLISTAEALRQLEKGGALTTDAESLIEEMTNQGQ
jgi:hypothetical protein